MRVRWVVLVFSVETFALKYLSTKVQKHGKTVSMTQYVCSVVLPPQVHTKCTVYLGVFLWRRKCT